MIFLIRIFVFVVVLGSFIGPVCAQEPDLPKIPAALQGLVDRGAQARFWVENSGWMAGSQSIRGRSSIIILRPIKKGS